MPVTQAVILVMVIIIAHFTQKTAQEVKKTNAKLDRLTEDMKKFMNGAEMYIMNARLKKD